MEDGADKEVLMHIENVVWSVDTSDEEKVRAIQGYLYQYGANMDHKTEQLWGDDDAHITKRKY